jgi:DNA-binding Lrp family transcriptional regulator
MDKIDISIIKELLSNSRITYKELSDKIKLTVPTIHKRVQSLIDEGIITRFKANLGIKYLNAIQVHFIGLGKIRNLEKIIKDFEKDENTSILHIGSNNHVHVGGLLKDISYLDYYTNYIKEKIDIKFQHIGLMSHSEYHKNWLSKNKDARENIELSKIDKKIILSLHENARKNISDLSKDVGYSVKTVKKSVDKLVKNNVLEFTIDWNPSFSGNIVPFIYIYLKEGIEKRKIFPTLENKYKSIIFNFMLHNVPNLIVSTAWVENLQELEELKNILEKEDGIDYVKPIIIFSGHHFLTWRERKLKK